MNMTSMPIAMSQNDALNECLAKAQEQAEQDPSRPMFHFRAPAQWMNDPNGTIYHGGFYHLFYQFNPYETKWGTMHWGHARSRDLVRWEHLPIALTPSAELGEEHCFSGCAYLDEQQTPILFYTSIGQRLPEQWAAIGDADLIAWRKIADNPFLKMADHHGVHVEDWRDPFVFHAGERTFMTLGGKIAGDSVAVLYEKGKDALTWHYQGVLFRHPDTTFRSLECPNFFALGEKWVLLDSPYGPVDCFIGTFDLDTLAFTQEYQGKADHSTHFYATNMYHDDNGRDILVGWIRDFEQPRGWNGCLSLPRELSIGSDGRLRQRPIPELQQLRGEHRSVEACVISDASRVVAPMPGRQAEIFGRFDLRDARLFGLNIGRANDERQAIAIRYDGRELEVAGVVFPLSLSEDRDILTLHLFIDRSVMELFVNDGRACATSIAALPDDAAITLLSEGGAVNVTQLDVWEMRSIWPSLI